MKKIASLVLGISIIALAVLFVFNKKLLGISKSGNIPSVEISKPSIILLTPEEVNNQQGSRGTPVSDNSSFQSPLDRASERVIKKPFGIFITPQNSPVAPEKFHGYHTGADFEIFPTELSAEMPVRAVCSGKLVMKKYATGYGGVAVQACILDNQPITVVYGHLKLSSIAPAVGQNLAVGDALGVLGATYSQDTNGERKHLHLGFHKGTTINILGYVQNKAELVAWLDPCAYVCR